MVIPRPWEHYVKPFHMVGNLYFVGTRPSSGHLIDSGDGLILIDSGYPQNLYMVIDNIYRLGFRLSDLKYIVHSHGHYDHLGGTRALVELTGAKTFLGAADCDMATGKADLTWARELGEIYTEMFTPDVLIEDGDDITLGHTTIHCLSAPGHTPGTLALFFDVEEDGRTLRCGMHGGVGLNSMKKAFLDKYGLSLDCRRQFREGLLRLKNEHVDVTLGNHCGNNDTLGKAARIRPGAPNPFIDPTEWNRFLDHCLSDIDELIRTDI